MPSRPSIAALGKTIASIGAALVAAAAAAQPDASTAERLASGVWAYVDADGNVVVSGSFLGVPDDDTLTPAALERRQRFDFRRDDPVLGCGEPGMPRALTAASPMQFIWNGEDLTIRYESMDVRRFVDVDGPPASDATPRTPNGYAVAHWDGDVLVIETSRLDGRVVDLQGTPKSDAMTLEERYRVETVDAETYLRLDLTLTDPQTFEEPYAWHFDFVLKPDWELLDYACEERPAELTPGVAPEA